MAITKSGLYLLSIEKMMIDHLVRLMKENDSPKEQFERLGLKS